MSILYRIKQKLKYRFATDGFSKKVAEINRNKRIINLSNNNFYIREYNQAFNVKKHGFIIFQIELFLNIIDIPNYSFKVYDSILYFQTDNINLYVTSAEELFIIHEIWVEGCYNFDFKGLNKVVVIDIGMNVGFASLFFARKPFINKIYSFEPFEPTYLLAQKNLGLNPGFAKKINPKVYGLSSHDEVIEVDYSKIHRGQVGVWGTKLINDKISEVRKEKLHLKSFNNELRQIIHVNPDCDIVLKIDCEGSEYAIFKEMDNQLLDPVKIILLEWHIEGPDLIQKILEEVGFKVLSLYPENKKAGMLYAFK